MQLAVRYAITIAFYLNMTSRDYSHVARPRRPFADSSIHRTAYEIYPEAATRAARAQSIGNKGARERRILVRGAPAEETLRVCEPVPVQLFR